MIKYIVLMLVIILLSPSNLIALSENEWQSLMERSSLFRFAEQKLNTEWNKQYTQKPDSPQKQALLDAQKKWIRIERDIIANQYIKQGMSYENAYIKATLDRVDYLKNIQQSENKINNIVKQNKDTPSVENSIPQQSARNITYTQHPSEQTQLQSNVKNQGSKYRYGPIVCGFQLGMTKDEAILNAQRLNFPVEKHNWSNDCCCYSGHIFVFFEFDAQTNLVTSFTLSEDLFNSKNISVQQFAQMFSNYWKIKFEPTKYYGSDGFRYTYNNGNNGYKISIGRAFMPEYTNDTYHYTSEIEVSSIKK